MKNIKKLVNFLMMQVIKKLEKASGYICDFMNLLPESTDSFFFCSWLGDVN